jgi:hypothetical protein
MKKFGDQKSYGRDLLGNPKACCMHVLVVNSGSPWLLNLLSFVMKPVLLHELCFAMNPCGCYMYSTMLCNGFLWLLYALCFAMKPCVCYMYMYYAL